MAPKVIRDSQAILLNLAGLYGGLAGGRHHAEGQAGRMHAVAVLCRQLSRITSLVCGTAIEKFAADLTNSGSAGQGARRG